MDLYNLKLEMRALLTLTDPDISKNKRLSLLGRMDKRMYSTEITKQAFARVSKAAAASNDLMDWDDLITDPRLSSEVRSELGEYSDQAGIPIKKWKSTIASLDKYRKRRELNQLGRTIAQLMESKDEEVDEDQLLVDVADRLNTIKSSRGEDHKVIKFGAGGNALKFAEQTLAKPAEKLLKTGYKDYDDVNGGLPTSGVLLMAGSTSGGKSVLSQNLLARMAKSNADLNCLKITLEMTAEQEMNRMLSMASGVPLWKIKQRKMTDREQKAVLRAAKRMQDEFEAVRSSYGFLSPDRGMSVDDVLWMATPYGANVVCIDYIGLLNDAAASDQWKSLSEVVRKCKVHATNTNTLYVILAQLDSESDKIRYSKGMLEHADVAWLWNYSDPEVRAGRKLPIRIAKARDGELFELPLDERFDIMVVGDNGTLDYPDEAEGLRKRDDDDGGFVGES